jgi:acyl-CoA dehydrogenase
MVSHDQMLAQSVRDVLAARCPAELVVEAEAQGGAPELWDYVESLGWPLASVPEELGGTGASFADGCAILRIAAYHAAPLPLAETGLLAGWVLSRCGIDVPPGPLTVAPVRLDETLQLREGGRATGIPWASSSSAIVALAGDGSGQTFVRVVPPSETQVTDGKNLAGEPRGDVEFAPLGGGEVVAAPEVVTPEEVFRRGALARAVAMLGALERVRDMSLAYARDREQFGRPIGRFQAVGHHLAIIAGEVALARVAVESAIDATRDDEPAPLVELAVAKVICGRAARAVPMRAHQVHGAIGFTQEYSLQLLTRRLWAWRDEFGSEFHWARMLAEAAASSEDGIWGLITATQPPTPDTGET